MRVLFTTWSSPSHLYPLVPMAWACRAAGHEVRFAGMPSAVPGIVGAGLTATAVGSDEELTGMSASGKLAAWHKQEQWPADWPEHPDRLSPAQVELLAALGRKQCVIAERMVDDLVAVVERWRPDLIVSDVSTFAGAVAGAVAGIPVVAQLWGSPGVLRYENRALGEEPLPEYAALFARFGLDAPVDPAALLDPCPPSMNLGSALPRLPMRFVPYNSAGEVPSWADDPAVRPRVCVTWGVTAAKVLGAAGLEPLRRIVTAVAGLGAEPVVAVTAAQRELLPALPDGTRVVESMPLQLLMPHCDAIVHQGGAGTALTAAAYGVPQLVVPQRPAPMLLADRLAATGAGRTLPHHVVAGDEHADKLVADALDALLTDPAHRDAAVRLAEENAAQPSPAELVPALAALAAR
ncbi:nucleotide disphospho-sugar-binding domain-containing protein [Streptomyces spororaveus]|uniref:nucleotide disphospho-sugar-binding domain-containing protein n=1 Tax=Streptomyces spororaveus TaxID=284039 RepID=UPI0036989E36